MRRYLGPLQRQEMVRLSSSVGVGRCMECGAPCMAGWSHMDPDDGICPDCAFLIAGPEFVGEVLGDGNLAADLNRARDEYRKRLAIPDEALTHHASPSSSEKASVKNVGAEGKQSQ